MKIIQAQSVPRMESTKSRGSQTKKQRQKNHIKQRQGV